jgi:hypothetical protein
MCGLFATCLIIIGILSFTYPFTYLQQFFEWAEWLKLQEKVNGDKYFDTDVVLLNGRHVMFVLTFATVLYEWLHDSYFCRSKACSVPATGKTMPRGCGANFEHHTDPCGWW